MAKVSEKLMVYCLVAIFVVIAMVEGAKGATICNIPSSRLNLCRPAVTGRYPPPPTKQCCLLIKHADLNCLCNFKDVLPAFNINPSRAFALPKKCKYNLHIPPKCRDWSSFELTQNIPTCDRVKDKTAEAPLNVLSYYLLKIFLDHA
ncbi:hypothetical protein Gotur_035149 [Gossypium turneri]